MDAKDAERGLSDLADMGSLSIGLMGLALIVAFILIGIGIRVYSRSLRSMVRSWAYLAVLGLLLLAWLFDAMFRLGTPPQLILAIFAALLVFKITVEVQAPVPYKSRSDHPNPSESYYLGIGGSHFLDTGGFGQDSGGHSGGPEGGGGHGGSNGAGH